jgi:hypothetical protein
VHVDQTGRHDEAIHGKRFDVLARRRGDAAERHDPVALEKQVPHFVAAGRGVDDATPAEESEARRPLRLHSRAPLLATTGGAAMRFPTR